MQFPQISWPAFGTTFIWLSVYCASYTCVRSLTTPAGSVVQGLVSCLACLPPSTNLPMPLLLSGSADRCIKIWNPNRGNAISPSVLVQTLYRHEGTVTVLATCADHIISGSTDNTVRLWRCSENCQALLYPPFEQARILVTMPAWIVSIAVADSVAQHSSDGSLIVGDFDANIKQIYFTISTRLGIKRCGHTDALFPRCNVTQTLVISGASLFLVDRYIFTPA